MPLEDRLPRIDDRRYDDILAEARARIPAYTPEWTDLNDNDPGMTLVQLFAWMTDMLLYRLGQVPALNYIKFLQLLGIELQPAEPALAEITFPVREDTTDPYILVPRRAQVSAPSTDGGGPVLFETERSLTALTAGLRGVQAFDGYAFMDVTAQNAEPGAGFQPFGTLAAPGSALLLGFGYPATSPLNYLPEVELDLAFLMASEDRNRATTDCSLAAIRAHPPAQLHWEGWNGREWQSVSLLKDETVALTRTGHILLKLPPKGTLVPAAIGAVAQAYFWLRARLETSQYDVAPALWAIRTNTMAATQAETVEDEVLGGTTGAPNQTFRVTNTPVLRDTLRLEIDEGTVEGFRPWKLVDDFFASGPADRHYVLDRTTGEIRLGDGTNGAIAVANPSNPTANVVAREYRVGGGKRGNVGPDTLKTLLVTVTGLDESGVTNLRAAAGGQDEEALGAAQKRAALTLKSQCRAVTTSDYELLAMQAGNVKRAKALPLFHPDFPDVSVPGVVTVIVVPDTDDPAPSPNESTRRAVCDYLNLRRLLTAELYVIKPEYHEVEVRAEVFAQDDADLADVKRRIEQSLLDYFHPLKGGENGDGWPFGGTIFYSRVYQRLSLPGVQSIEKLTILLDGEESPECANVPTPKNSLLFSTQHDITVNYQFTG